MHVVLDDVLLEVRAAASRGGLSPRRYARGCASRLRTTMNRCVRSTTSSVDGVQVRPGSTRNIALSRRVSSNIVKGMGTRSWQRRCAALTNNVQGLIGDACHTTWQSFDLLVDQTKTAPRWCPTRLDRSSIAGATPSGRAGARPALLGGLLQHRSIRTAVDDALRPFRLQPRMPRAAAGRGKRRPSARIIS